MYYTLDTSPWPIFVSTLHPSIREVDIEAYFRELDAAVTEQGDKFMSIMIMPKAYLSANVRVAFGRKWSAFQKKHADRLASTIIVANGPMAQMMFKGILLSMKEKLDYETVRTLEVAKEKALQWVKVYLTLPSEKTLMFSLR